MRRLEDVIVADYAVGMLGGRVFLDRRRERIYLGRGEVVFVVTGALGGVLEGVESSSTRFIFTVHLDYRIVAFVFEDGGDGRYLVSVISRLAVR